MTQQAEQVEGKAPETKVKKAREARSYNVRLDAPGETMLARAFRTRTGWRAEVVIISGSGKRTRGATSEHADEKAARAAVDEAAAKAAKLGWALRPARSFKRAADAWDLAHMPAPGKPTSKK
jgi:hypothetical protein